jgi:hypothetical protein
MLGARLAMLEKLTSLNLLQNERISNRGAAALAALTNLKALNLSNTASTPLHFVTLWLSCSVSALYSCHGIEDGAWLNDLQNGLQIKMSSTKQLFPRRHGYFPCG